jgi:hypothetical protein
VFLFLFCNLVGVITQGLMPSIRPGRGSLGSAGKHLHTKELLDGLIVDPSTMWLVLTMNTIRCLGAGTASALAVIRSKHRALFDGISDARL